MNHKKRIVIALILVLCSLAVCSCGLSSFKNSKDSLSKYNPSELNADDYPFAKETMMTILKCFNEDDSVSLKELFSETLMLEYDIDKQIEEAMKFYKDNCVSHADVRCGIRESNFREERYIYKNIRIVMEDVVTDKNNKYDIEVECVLVNDDDKTQVGLSKLFISDSNNSLETYCLIGDGGNYPKNKQIVP